MPNPTDVDAIWSRIERNAGSTFCTATGLQFTYSVPGNYLRIQRDGHEVNRSLSRTNFARALSQMPAERPSELRDRQGPSYTWAILMDPRVRSSDW